MSAARPPEGANSAPPPASGLPDLGELTDLLKKAGIDTSALLQSLTAATAAVLKPSAPAAPLVVTPASIAAATRGCFLPSDLARAMGAATSSAELERLLAQSDVITTGRQRAWQLRTDARRDILLQASREGLLRSGIEQLGAPPDVRDREGWLLRLVLSGRMPDLDTLSLEELEQFATVAQWLSGTKLAEIPTPEELRRLIGQREILDPFRTLVGRTVQAGGDGADDRVVGRVKELERLRAYVGLREPEELKFYVTRALSSLWSTVTFSDDANQPLLIQGIGGMGKSTLIAKFVLDHALFPGVSLPFVYLDFDRAALAPRQPLQLLIEIAVQLGLRFPAMEKGLKELRGKLRDTIDSQARNVNRRQRESVTSSELNYFCATLRDVVEDVNGRSSPVLMLFDTFEVVQYDEEAVSGVRALIAALRQPDATPWDDLRIVVAGRGDLADITTSHDPLVLRRLSLAATSELLRRRSDSEGLGLLPAQVKVLAPALTNSPLDVIVVTNWLKDRKPEERASLIDDLMREATADEEQLATDAPSAGEEIVSRRITGILIKRMIRHINDDDVRELAIPGLVVRAVTPEIIRDVMAPASGVSSADKPLPAGSEDEMWRRLERERWLVSRRGNVLRHRPEVRRAMLDLMRQQNKTAFARTNELALATFRKHADADIDARAETIYHLLLGGKPLEEAEAYWTPTAGQLLASAVDDLDERGQGYLKAKLGRSVPIETLTSFPAPILLSLLTASGPRYLRRLGPDAMLQVLESASDVGAHAAVVDLRYEALYRAGRWDSLRDAAGAQSAPVGDACGLLWRGELDRLASADEPTQNALRFLLRWATRDPGVDDLWASDVVQFTSAVDDPARVLANETLCWDFATLFVCGGSGGRRLPFNAHQRDAILDRCGDLCASLTRLPDAAAGSDALRILAFFEHRGDRPILRRIDFDNHFATVSGREIQALRDLMQVRFDGNEDPAAKADRRAHEHAVERGRALLDKLQSFPDDVVIADVTLKSEYAAVVRAVVDAGGQRPLRAALRTLALKHPDWLQPLGSALTRAFRGDVPRRIGWWSTIDKYLGSGEQPRKRKDNADGQSLMSLADEASSLPEAVAAYERLLRSGNASDDDATNFLALATAFSQWVEMIDDVLDDPRNDEPDGRRSSRSARAKRAR